MVAWAADDAAGLDHGDREKELAESGRDLQRQLLEATFAIDSAREERIVQVTSAAGIRHGTVEKGHDRGVASIFGPVRAVRLAYRNRREPNLYPADARWGLADDPYSMGMRAWSRITWPAAATGRPGDHRGQDRGHGRPRSADRAGLRPGRLGG